MKRFFKILFFNLIVLTALWYGLAFYFGLNEAKYNIVFAVTTIGFLSIVSTSLISFGNKKPNKNLQGKLDKIKAVEHNDECQCEICSKVKKKRELREIIQRVEEEDGEDIFELINKFNQKKLEEKYIIGHDPIKIFQGRIEEIKKENNPILEEVFIADGNLSVSEREEMPIKNFKELENRISEDENAINEEESKWGEKYQDEEEENDNKERLEKEDDGLSDWLEEDLEEINISEELNNILNDIEELKKIDWNETENKA